MRLTSYLPLILSEVSDGKFCFTVVWWFVGRLALGVACCLNVLTGLVGVASLVDVVGFADVGGLVDLVGLLSVIGFVDVVGLVVVVKIVTLYNASVSDKHKENCCNVFIFSAAVTLV